MTMELEKIYRGHHLLLSERKGFKTELLNQTVTHVLLCFQRFPMNQRVIAATLGKINTAHKEPDMLPNKNFQRDTSFTSG